MGFLDKALKTGKDLLAKNADKVDQAIEKAGDLVDQKTQGKYADTVDKVQDAAKKAVEKNTVEGGAAEPPTPPPAQTPPPNQTPPAPSAPPAP
ncbi:MAG: antitoxin [Mycobacterium sp.]